MRTLGNLIWLVFGGFFAAAGYIIGGLLLCVTIIGIPFGLQAIRLGGAMLAPFGKHVERVDERHGGIKLILDLIWLVVVGWGLALNHIVFGLILGVTIIGLPWAKQHFKLVPVALMPFTYRLAKGGGAASDAMAPSLAPDDVSAA